MPSFGTLGKIRELFRNLSGRLDLAPETGEDAGCDMYINAGQRMLDQMQETPHSRMNRIVPLHAKMGILRIPNLRVLDEVWVSDSMGYRAQLSRLKLADFRATYPDLIHLSVEAGGVPTYFAETPLGYCPEQKDVSEAIDPLFLDGASDMDDIMIGDSYPFRGILFAPTPDKDYTIRIIGRFFSDYLSDAEDRTYWTHEQPLLLTYASLFHLETAYRNSEGQAAWLGAIRNGASMIDADLVKDDSATIERIGE